MGSRIIGAVLSAVVGIGLASATVVGLVYSQTAAPEQNPTNAQNPAINYGS